MTQHMTAAEFRKHPPRVGGRRVTPETALKSAAKDWLSYHGWSHWPHPAGSIRTPEGMFIARTYPGQSDIEAIKDGRTIYIECKVANRLMSPDQEAFRAMIEAAGGTYLVVRDVEDLEVLEGR